MKAKEFYEVYWQKDGAPPEGDSTTAERTARLQAALQPLLRTGRPDSFNVLDAGCGNGEFAAFLRGMGFRVAGIDLSGAAVEKARRKCPDADIRMGWPCTDGCDEKSPMCTRYAPADGPAPARRRSISANRTVRSA